MLEINYKLKNAVMAIPFGIRARLDVNDFWDRYTIAVTLANGPNPDRARFWTERAQQREKLLCEAVKVAREEMRKAQRRES